MTGRGIFEDDAGNARIIPKNPGCMKEE